MKDSKRTTRRRHSAELKAQIVSRHEPLAELACKVFESEYNDVWQDGFERLENWVEANDVMLEATKNEF